jgi:hypothetical protein
MQLALFMLLAMAGFARFDNTLSDRLTSLKTEVRLSPDKAGIIYHFQDHKKPFSVPTSLPDSKGETDEESKEKDTFEDDFLTTLICFWNAESHVSLSQPNRFAYFGLHNFSVPLYVLFHAWKNFLI